jgi:hypothetical protein
LRFKWCTCLAPEVRSVVLHVVLAQVLNAVLNAVLTEDLNVQSSILVRNQTG